MAYTTPLVQIGCETEVVYDFVFEPPQAAIGLQRSVRPIVGAHCCTALFTCYVGVVMSQPRLYITLYDYQQYK